jgi:tetratricopeptide (TPR) repeat protein
MKTPSILLAALLCAFCAVNGFSGARIKQMRHSMSFRFKSPQSRMPAEFTDLLAGEFHGALADYFLLEVGSFVGSNQNGTETDYANIYQTLKTVLTLDPYFMQAYLYAQALLPWDGHRPDWANGLLAVAKVSRPWDWRPGYYMAFNYYYFLGDYAKASELLLEAARIKNAPALLAVLGGRFAAKGGRSQAAIVMLKAMLQDKSLAAKDRQEIGMRIAELQEIVKLEDAVARYKRDNGRFPPDLAALLNQGLVAAIPLNRYGSPYYYDPNDGEVAIDNLQDRRLPGTKKNFYAPADKGGATDNFLDSIRPETNQGTQ